MKFIIPRHLRDPSLHPVGVFRKVKATRFQTKCHLDYTLKDKDIYFYINPKTSHFWINGVELEASKPTEVSKHPSGNYFEF
jgi:hypothetical protein